MAIEDNMNSMIADFKPLNHEKEYYCYGYAHRIIWL